MSPGLENATFERFGQMHRNSYIASPHLLNEDLSFKQFPGLFVAGQLSGIEGYAGNIASGLVAGLNAERYMHNKSPLIFPKTTMIGALTHYITHADLKDFQPMKAMFGLLPPLEGTKRHAKRERYNLYSQRALADIEQYLTKMNLV
jgi:methylenetetrahydrofolate--tRNA-(uracil-5-)-methyltransferase